MTGMGASKLASIPLKVDVSRRAFGLAGLLLVGAAIGGILVARPVSGPFPDHVVLLGISIYLLGPLGAALLGVGAASWLGSSRSVAFATGAASYLAGLFVFLVLAVNLGAVAP